MKNIDVFVIRSINYAYEHNMLSIHVTQRHGIITWLPKSDKPKCLKKKIWRPISLLNTVYKIASGSIANKIKNVWIRYPKMTKQDLYEGEL